MKTIAKLIVIVMMIYCVISDQVNYQDCGSKYNLENVYIEGCNQESSCIFHPKEQRNIFVQLYATNFVSQMFYQEVHLIFGTIYVPLTVRPDDLCTMITCPVRLSQNASFNAIMDFSYLPNVQSAVTLNWVIYNENNQKVMCMEVKAKYEFPK